MGEPGPAFLIYAKHEGEKQKSCEHKSKRPKPEAISRFRRSRPGSQPALPR